MTKEQFLLLRKNAPTDYDEDNYHFVFYTDKSVYVHEYYEHPRWGRMTKFLFSCKSFLDLRTSLMFGA